MPVPPRLRPRRFVATCVAVAGLGLAGLACGDDAPDGTAGAPVPTGPTGTMPPSQTAPDDTFPPDGTMSPVGPPLTTDVRPPDGMGEPWVAGFLEPAETRDPEPAEVIGIVETGDDTAPLVVFWSGPPECWGLDRIEVEETDTEVRAVVFVGWVGEDDQVCITLAVRHAATLQLEQPLGARPFVTEP